MAKYALLSAGLLSFIICDEASHLNNLWGRVEVMSQNSQTNTAFSLWWKSLSQTSQYTRNEVIQHSAATVFTSWSSNHKHSAPAAVEGSTEAVPFSENPGVSGSDVAPSTPAPSFETTISSTTAPPVPAVPANILKLVANLSHEFPSPFPHPPVCGATNAISRPTTQISDGAPSKKGDWPWMVVYGYILTGKKRPKDNNPRFLCGGSLITDRHTITAAHCIHVRYRKMVVARLGVVDLDDKGAVNINTSRRIVHPDSGIGNGLTNDLAIVTLVTPVTFSAYIKPICLPFPEAAYKNESALGAPSIAGWGAMFFGGGAVRQLREAQVQVVDNLECRQIYKMSNVSIDEKSQLCAVGEDGKDSCQGDSGGPLMQPWLFHYFLSGIISFGYKCGTPGIPGVYTRVASYLGWIANVTIADAKAFNSSSTQGIKSRMNDMTEEEEGSEDYGDFTDELLNLRKYIAED